jgi:hypothetical protein
MTARSDIIELVRAKMDEVHPFDQGATITDVQIEKQLDGAAVSLVEMLPSVLANPVSAEDIEIDNHVSGEKLDIVCPDDFVRIHRIKLSGWVRAVVELMPDGNRLLYEQDYDYLKATIRRPKAALYRKDGLDYITCFPAPKITDPDEEEEPEPEEPVYVEEFVYVQRPDVAEDLDESLFDMLAWKTAGVIYTISRQKDIAEQCYQKLNEIISNKLKYRG